MSKRYRGARRKMRCIVQVVGKNYRFLHDAIFDLFVELLKADLKSLSAGKLGEISLASKWCPTVDSSYDKATLKTGKAKIVAGALLPHEIIGALNDEDSGKVAELQWKRMVDDMVKKGKLSDCIAVCDVTGSMNGIPMEVFVALGVLVSECLDRNKFLVLVYCLQGLI